MNFSSRTVIGPDVTLKMGEMALPEFVAQQLTIPETVNDINKKHLQELIENGKVNYYTRNGTESRINMKYAYNKNITTLEIGDKLIRNGRQIEIDSYNKDDFKLTSDDLLIRGDESIDIILPIRKRIVLENGDVVERQLRNGDLVILNRQPTLHVGSIFAKRIVIRPYSTFRMPLACTSSYNGDFDGD